MNGHVPCDLLLFHALQDTSAAPFDVHDMSLPFADAFGGLTPVHQDADELPGATGLDGLGAAGQDAPVHVLRRRAGTSLTDVHRGTCRHPQWSKLVDAYYGCRMVRACWAQAC